MQEHWLEQASIAKRLDQAVAASLVLEDLDAAAAGDAVGVEQVEGIVGADVDLVPGLAWGGWEDVEEIEGRGTTIHCLVQGVDLLRPARVPGQPPVLGVDEGLGREGDHFIGLAPGAKEKRGESAGGCSGHHDAFRASTLDRGGEEGAHVRGRIADAGNPELIPAAARVSQKRLLCRETLK